MKSQRADVLLCMCFSDLDEPPGVCVCVCVCLCVCMKTENSAAVSSSIRHVRAPSSETFRKNDSQNSLDPLLLSNFIYL